MELGFTLKSNFSLSLSFDEERDARRFSIFNFVDFSLLSLKNWNAETTFDKLICDFFKFLIIFTSRWSSIFVRKILMKTLDLKLNLVNLRLSQRRWQRHGSQISVRRASIELIFLRKYPSNIFRIAMLYRLNNWFNPQKIEKK